MSDATFKVRRIEHGATWTVVENGAVVASGIECCESCAARAATSVITLRRGEQP